MSLRPFKSFIAASVVGLSIALTPGVASAETLADALIAAYRSSNLLDQNRALLRATDEDVAVAVSQLRPVVNFTAQSTYFHGDSINTSGQRVTGENLSSTLAITAEMTLLDFGRSRIGIEAAKETVLATREALIGIEQQVLLGAVAAFVDVRLNDEIVALRQSNVRVIGQELQAAQDRFEVGEITRTDVAIAEARLAAARSALAAAEGDRAVARESYKAATGAYPGRLSAPSVAPKTARTLDEAKAVALRTHPSVRGQQHVVAAAELNVARGAAAMKPTLTGRARVGVDDRGLEDQSLTLTFNQTLYAGGRPSALYRQALARRDAARSELLQSTVGVAQDVGNAWARLSVAGASIEASKQQVQAARTAYEGVREEATLGARTTLDVLNAEQELLDAQASRVSAEATQYVAVYSLLAAMGLLTVDHLKLGIPTYDAAAYYNAVKNAPATSSQGKRLDRVLKSIGN